MNLLESFMLSEGTNYLSMFNDFIGTDEKARQTIEKYVSWAKTNLKKNDRIVWFLRWVRIELAGKIKHTDSDVELSKTNKKLGTNYARYDLVPINNLMTNLAHFLSLPIPKIQGTVWSKQSPQDLLREFKEFEDFWKETSDKRNLIPYYEGDEPTKILEFPDGYCWFDLEKASCSDEANAMGHCGNSPGRYNKETILSLRRLAHSVNGQTHWYPVCTFILDSNGELGEMKGRNNDKPVDKYHPYIVALLRLPIIKGIKGGGYLPEHNFSLNDLDRGTRDELIDEKPDLGDAYELYQKEGMTDRVMKRVESGLGNADLPTGDLEYRPEHKDFVVEEWSNFEDFLSSMGDEPAQKILEIALGEADFQVESEEAPETFISVAQELPPFWQQKMIARAGVKDEHGSYSTDDMVIQAANKLMADDDDWYRTFEELFHSNSRIEEEAWEHLFDYAEEGWPFSCQHAWTNIPARSDDVAAFKQFVVSKQKVLLTVPESDIVAYASADTSGESDDEYGYDIQRMSGHGGRADWSHLDSDYYHERRREAGLTNQDGNDEWLADSNFGNSQAMADRFINALTSGTATKTINDPRQQDFKFEGFRRLLQLAGL